MWQDQTIEHAGASVGPGPASADEIGAYLGRIGFDGAPSRDAAGLAALHRRHVEAIAWENLDLFCGRPIPRGPRQAFDKIVRGGRGGWCYEMNGLFAWMLESLGFTVTRLAAGVMREAMGDNAMGNHLALLVHLDRIWLADVGLGSGLAEPIPLAPGEHRQRFATFRLEPLGGDWWRFHNQPQVMPPSFDFSTSLTDEALLEDRSRWLQTDPQSPLRGAPVVQRHFPDRLESLVGATRTRVDMRGATPAPIDDRAGYERVLAETFGLVLDDAGPVWTAASR